MNTNLDYRECVQKELINNSKKLSMLVAHHANIWQGWSIKIQNSIFLGKQDKKTYNKDTPKNKYINDLIIDECLT
jgi:hypothetical protein